MMTTRSSTAVPQRPSIVKPIARRRDPKTILYALKQLQRLRLHRNNLNENDLKEIAKESKTLEESLGRLDYKYYGKYYREEMKIIQAEMGLSDTDIRKIPEKEAEKLENGKEEAQNKSAGEEPKEDKDSRNEVQAEIKREATARTDAKLPITMDLSKAEMDKVVRFIKWLYEAVEYEERELSAGVNYPNGTDFARIMLDFKVLAGIASELKKHYRIATDPLPAKDGTEDGMPS